MHPPLNPPDKDTEDKVGHPERYTNKKQQEISMEKGTCEHPPTDDELSETTDTTSPTRAKKLRTERDLTYTHERTRSKLRNKGPLSQTAH